MSATSAIAIWPYEGFRDAVDALNFSDYRSPEEHAKAAGQDLINSGKCLLVAAAGAVALFVPFFPVALAGGIVAGTGVTCAVTAAIAAPVELIRAGVISTGATSDKAPDTQITEPETIMGVQAATATKTELTVQEKNLVNYLTVNGVKPDDVKTDNVYFEQSAKNVHAMSTFINAADEVRAKAKSGSSEKPPTLTYNDFYKSAKENYSPKQALTDMIAIRKGIAGNPVADDFENAASLDPLVRTEQRDYAKIKPMPSLPDVANMSNIEYKSFRDKFMHNYMIEVRDLQEASANNFQPSGYRDKVDTQAIMEIRSKWKAAGDPLYNAREGDGEEAAVKIAQRIREESINSINKGGTPGAITEKVLAEKERSWRTPTGPGTKAF